MPCTSKPRADGIRRCGFQPAVLRRLGLPKALRFSFAALCSSRPLAGAMNSC